MWESVALGIRARESTHKSRGSLRRVGRGGPRRKKSVSRRK